MGARDGGSVSAWMPMYWGDYLRDTGHLTAAEHGAYLLLIAHYWTTGEPLPNDDRRLARIARMSDAEWADARSMLVAFFEHRDGKLVHRRVEAELESASGKKIKNSQRASAAANARWNASRTAPSTASSNAPSISQAMLEECPPPSPIKSTPLPPRADDRFDEGWEAFPPKRKGSRERAAVAWKSALRRHDGLGPETILDGIRRYVGSDEVARGFVKGMAAWLNDDRWTVEYDPADGRSGPPADSPPALQIPIVKQASDLALQRSSGYRGTPEEREAAKRAIGALFAAARIGPEEAERVAREYLKEAA